MRRLPCLLAVLLTVWSARADEPSPLVLEVRASRIDPGQLDHALRAELQQDAPPGGQLQLQEQDSEHLVLTYRDATGNVATRELVLSKDDPELLEKVTLAAANLVRDESRALLAALRTQQPAPPAAEPVEPPPPVQLGAPAAPAAYRPCKDGQVVTFGADVFPLLGSSSSARQRAMHRKLSLNLVGGYSAGVRRLAISVGVNIDRRGTCGLEAALANVSLGPVHGVQLGLANFARHELLGVQLGVANFSGGAVRGAQLGVLNLGTGRVNTQVGTTNFARRGSAVQVGVGNLTLGNVQGAQVGAANVAHGQAKVQVGVINYADSARAPLGVISIVRDGPTTLDVWGNENGTLLAGLTHGGDLVYNLYGAGVRVGPAGTRTVFALGLGVHLADTPRVRWDLELLNENVLHRESFALSGMTTRLRVAITFKLNQRVGLFLAPGYATLLTDDDERMQSPWGGTLLARSNDSMRSTPVRLYGFVSLGLGLRINLRSAREANATQPLAAP